MTPLSPTDKRIERETKSVEPKSAFVSAYAGTAPDGNPAPIRPPVKSFDWFQSDERRAWP